MMLRRSRPIRPPVAAASRRRALQRLGLLSLAPLAGCQALGVVRAPFAVLQPRPALPALAGEPVPWQLVVEVPAASDTLDTPHIAVMPSPGELQVYPEARWPDPMPRMLQALVLRGFQQSGRIVGAAMASSGVRADVVLALDVHDFQVERPDGDARAAIRLQARLIDARRGRVIDARPFAAEAPAAGRTAAAALPAFEQALGELIPQLVAWALDAGRPAAVPSERREPPR